MVLKFDEESHSYYSGDKKLTSVTKLVHKYSSPFDKEDILNKIFSKSFHPEIYLGPNLKYRFFTKDMIKQQWKNKADYGTFIHDLAEQLCNGEEVQVKCPEVNQIKRFLKKEGYTVVHSEMKIYSEKLGVAGTVDLLLEKDGKYHIADWKTNSGKDLSDKFGDRWTKYMLKPLSNIPELPFWQYSLQTSVYQHILQNEERYHLKDDYKDEHVYVPGTKIMEFGENIIIHLIGNKDENPYDMKRIDYKIIKVPFMESEVKNMLKELEDEK